MDANYHIAYSLDYQGTQQSNKLFTLRWLPNYSYISKLGVVEAY